MWLAALLILALVGFPLGAPDMSTVIVRINGTDVSEYVLFERANFQAIADGQPGMANLVLDDPDHDLSKDDINAGMTLELYIDGTREWDGWVFKVGRTWPFEADDTTNPSTTPRFWRIHGFDRNLLFQKRFMYRTADPSDNQGFKIWDTGTSDKTAIDYALANYVDLTGDGIDTSSGIEEIASPGPYEDFTLGFVSAPFGVLFDDAAKITGGVFYIGPDRVLYYVDDLTVTAPAILSDVKGAGRVQYRDFNAGLDYNQAANEALVWGAGKGDANPVYAKYTDADSVSTHGLWQWGDIYVGASKQTTVNRRARTYVEGSPSHRRGHNDPVPVVTATVFDQGFRVGQVATIESDVFGYSEDLPIRKSTITFPTPGQPKWDLELTLRVDSPFGVPDVWNYRFPPYSRPDVPVGGWDPPVINLPENTTLIDHYDNPPAAGCGDLSDYVATSKSTGTTHSVVLPSHAIGQTLHVFVVETYPTTGFPISDYLENTLGFTYDNWQTVDSPDHALWSYHKVLDGTEPFFGGTLTLTTPDSQTVMIMATVVDGAVSDNATNSSYLDADPPLATPSSPDSGTDALWLAISISLQSFEEDVVPGGYVNAWDDGTGQVYVKAALKNGTWTAEDPAAFASIASSTYSRAALTVGLKGGSVPVTPCEKAVAITKGTYTGSGELAFNLPTSGMEVGKYLVLAIGHDQYNIPGPPIFDPAYDLQDSLGWRSFTGFYGSYYYGNPDFGARVLYKRIDGTEGDVFSYTPYLYGTLSQDANWVTVATVMDLKPWPTDPTYIDAAKYDSGTAWTSVDDPTASSAGYWRYIISVLTNSAAVTNIPDGWTLVGSAEFSPELSLHLYAVDTGYLANGETFDTPATAFDSTGLRGLTVFMPKMPDTGVYDPIPSEADNESGGASTPWVTPGPDVTGADGGIQPGGNEYTEGGTGEIEVGDSVVTASGGTYVWWRLQDGQRAIVDDPDGTFTGYTGVSQGDWRGTYDGVSEITPEAPWHEPLSLLIKFKATSRDDATRDGYINVEQFFLQRDGADATHTQGVFPTSWAGEWWVGIYWYVSDGQPVTFLELMQAEYGGTGILQSVEPDPQDDVSYADGSSIDVYGGGWDHYVWWNLGERYGFNIEQGAEYYLLIDVDEMHNAQANARKIKVKIWRTDTEEPSDWAYVDVLPSYKASATSYQGLTNARGRISGSSGWEQTLLEFWIRPDDGTEVDAVWRGTASYGGSVEASGGVPSLHELGAVSATYRTAYPYAAGSLNVWFEGQRLRPGIDFVESDPANGLFTKLLGNTDVSASLYVRYTKDGLEPTSG